MQSLKKTLFALAIAAGSTAALAGGDPPAILDVSGSAVITTELSTFIGFASDTDASAGVVGTLTLVSPDFSDPNPDIELVDLDLMLVPAAMTSSGIEGGDFLGPAGPAGIVLNTVSLAPSMGAPTPTESEALATFEVGLALGGNAFASYELFSIEPVENASVDLASLDPATAFLEIFSINSVAGELTVEASLFFETTTVPFEPGLVEVNLSSGSNISLVANGEDPTADNLVCSRVDIAEPCGLLDLADIVAFVTGFNTSDPISDLDGNDLYDLQDIVGFVTLFNGANCDPAGTYYCYTPGGYAAIEFHEGNARYAFGDHSTLTAGIAVSGAALMLGFGSFRRKQA